MCNQQLTGFLYICISQQGKTTKVPCILCSSSPINITEINLNVYMQAFWLPLVPKMINAQRYWQQNAEVIKDIICMKVCLEKQIKLFPHVYNWKKSLHLLLLPNNIFILIFAGWSASFAAWEDRTLKAGLLSMREVISECTFSIGQFQDVRWAQSHTCTLEFTWLKRNIGEERAPKIKCVWMRFTVLSAALLYFCLCFFSRPALDLWAIVSVPDCFW